MSKYLIFSVVGVMLLIQSSSGMAVAVAFPQIISSFGTSFVMAGLVLSVFQLTMIATIPLAGKASDTVGHKRTYMFLVVLFTIGSLLCAIAPNIYWLILFRGIQGIGAGGLIPAATGIVADAFPRSRQRSIGLASSILVFGMVLGPNMGGWLTQSFGWRSVFWFAIPWSIAALIGGAILLKQDRKLARADLDMKGAGLFALSTGALTAGLTILGSARTQMAWAEGVSLLIVGSAVMIVFLGHERHIKSPIIDGRMLRDRPFLAANVYNVILGLLWGVFTLFPLYAISVYRASTLESGLFQTPMTIGMMVTSVVGSFLLVRWGYRKPMIAGTALAIFALFILSFESNGVNIFGLAVSGIPIMLFIFALAGLGFGFTLPASNNACIELMPDCIATITSLRNVFRNIGAVLGITLASMVLDRFGDVARGFQFVLFGTGLFALIAIPCIIAMPRSPSDVPKPCRTIPTPRS